MSVALNREQIEALLPHREPFIFVDRVLKIDDTSAVGIKEVSEDEYYFKGHFPGRPVMPGVLIVEALAQLSGLVELKRRELQKNISFLAGIDHVRFRHTVVPGDSLELHVKIVKAKKMVVLAECVAKVGDKVACEATIMLAYTT